MAIDIEKNNNSDLTGYYSRVTGEDGDTIYLDFSKNARNRNLRLYVPFNYGVAWQCTPGTGATVTVEFAFRPDYDKTESSHWRSHATQPSLSSAAAEHEVAPLAAIRFTAASGDMTVEVWSPSEVALE